ncbi:hypothetical protein EVB99_008 [Rhizobium phage RHph_N3_19]|nr:hypothetical protein EVB99_008 [Rhizobium phage RHph_N3_19]
MLKGNRTDYVRKPNRAKVLDKIVTFAMTQTQLDLLQRHARIEGKSVSAIIRNCLRENGYLPVDQQ